MHKVEVEQSSNLVLLSTASPGYYLIKGVGVVLITRSRCVYLDGLIEYPNEYVIYGTKLAPGDKITITVGE